jgi:beta-ureidopropionase / N-carbamoyl-L-amino-acid hydrolase
MTIDIDSGRLLADLAALSGIGGRLDGGLDRVAWSDADLQARAWLRRRVEDMGWLVTTDAAMNVFGRASAKRLPRLLIGSHTDSVPAGGRLDGSYGVVAALEVARTLAEAGDPATEFVELVDFADEEGVRFPCGYFGSKALVGMLDVEALRATRDEAGMPAEQILRAVGVELGSVPAASKHLDDVAGYLEVHIEQGPILEQEAALVGVATGIFGFDRYAVEIIGRSEHGGTTPFELRADPVRAAADFIAGLERLVHEEHESGRATVGTVSSEGGAINFVAKRVHLTFEVRQPSLHMLQQTVEAAGALLASVSEAHGCVAELARHDRIAETKGGTPLAIEDAFSAPVLFDPRLVDCCERACVETGAVHRRMTAGTWHDAGILAGRRPAAMLLVPSHRGITHSPNEETSDAALVMGARALLRATRYAIASLGLGRAERR